MSSRFLPLLASVAIVAATPVHVRAQGAPVPAPALPDSMLEASDALWIGDATLQLRSGARGTTAPIGVRLVRSSRPRRGPRVTGPLPAMVRLGYAAALAFAGSADSLLARTEGPAGRDSLVATLAGVAGTLRFVRRADDDRRPTYGVVLATPAGMTATTLDSGEARAFVLRMRDLGERLDPDATPDYARVHERATQVDKPVVPAPGGCQPQYPEALRREGTTGEVLMQFVVSSVGVVHMESVKVLRSSHAGFEAAVRASLGCMRFLPAELRGRTVRSMVQQPFTFAIAPSR